MPKKPSKQEQIAQTRQYVEFLRKRLDYKNRVSPEEYVKTKEQYEKAKFRLKNLEN